MSIIEKALEKAHANQSGTPVSASAILRQRPVDVMIDDDMLRAIGVLTEPDQLHQHASEFRNIKRQLLTSIQASKKANARLLIVSSALAGEGKTYTAANLALSLARDPDYSVLLVDGDVRRPTISQRFHTDSRPGLMEILAQPQLDPESLVLGTSIDRLTVLPAGKLLADATELLASERMTQVVTSLLRVPNRIVVIDSLPLLLTTEARTLVTYAGQLIMVVRADETSHAALRHAIELVPEDVDLKLVLNAVERSRLAAYYGHEYGFDYHSAPAENE